MKDDARFAEAIARIDAVNALDPRTDSADGRDQPRELLFARRVYEWVERLSSDPSEELLLAARAHTLKRWEIPRDRYAMTTVAYHQWRNALAQHHADEAARILCAVGYTDEAISKVSAFITRENWPADNEACTLEDADCLVFLETKLVNYLDDWEEEKTLHILRRTAKKMTPAARELAKHLRMDQRAREVLTRALS